MKLSRTQKKNLIPVMLILANVVYFFVGGVIFQTLEYRPKTTAYKTSDSVDEFLQTLSDTSLGRKIGPTEGFKRKDVVSKLSSKDIRKFEAEFREVTRKRVIAQKPDWSFSNSLFFATTVVTTIGYGNLAPVTTAGRMFCIVYALIGIPLTLMLLAVVSSTLVKSLNDACARIVNKLRTYHSNLDREEISGDVTAPVWLALPILFIFLALVSSIYCALEGWDFGSSLYFIFITFTTIGFGDVVPHSKALTLLFQGIWVNLMLLYVGLSVVSITINLCASSLVRQLKKTGKYLKILHFFGEVENLDEEVTPSDYCTGDGLQSNTIHEKTIKTKSIPEEYSDQRQEAHEISPVNNDKSTTRLNSVQTSNTKQYGSLQN